MTTRPTETGHDRDGGHYRRLADVVHDLGSVAVACSGGVDSTFLLQVCADVLGPARVLAVTGDSPTLPRDELAAARSLADRIGVRHRVVPTDEMDVPAFVANPPDRCFHCKDRLFVRLKQVAAGEGLESVVDGTNADDLNGHRPGRRAALNHGVRSPLAEAGIGKAVVREMSRTRGLPTWDKPAMACLASRFPPGEEITPAKVARVEAAEQFLRELGCHNVRVRDHQGLARIELDLPFLQTLSAARMREIVGGLKPLGYRYVTVDLEGFRSGNLSGPDRNDAGPDDR